MKDKGGFLIKINIAESVRKDSDVELRLQSAYES